MSEETNGGRLDRIEEVLAETAALQREMQRAQMQDEFKFAEYRKQEELKFAEYRKQSEDRFARIESVLDHLTRLVGIFGDKSHQVDEKMKRIKNVL